MTASPLHKIRRSLPQFPFPPAYKLKSADCRTSGERKRRICCFFSFCPLSVQRTEEPLQHKGLLNCMCNVITENINALHYCVTEKCNVIIVRQYFGMHYVHHSPQCIQNCGQIVLFRKVPNWVKYLQGSHSKNCSNSLKKDASVLPLIFPLA